MSARGDGQAAAALTVTEALDQLVQCLAQASADTALLRGQERSGPEALRCLAECQPCRNHLLYLLDAPRPPHANRAVILARLRALPGVHAAHGRPGHPDLRPPRIRGIAS